MENRKSTPQKNALEITQRLLMKNPCNCAYQMCATHHHHF